jgi:hypothetical protein
MYISPAIDSHNNIGLTTARGLLYTFRKVHEDVNYKVHESPKQPLN